MGQFELGKGVRALVVVAHPDDETIWMGGTLARFAEANWTIVALCRKTDPDRMPKFLRAVERYRARGIICDLEDEGIMGVRESIAPIQAILREELPRKEWDVVFTHGANGEYGHPRHKGVHQAVKQMMQSGELRASHVSFFAYKLHAQTKIALPRERAPHRITLSNAEWGAKRNVVKQVYGFRPQSFENRSCSKIETFSAIVSVIG